MPGATDPSGAYLPLAAVLAAGYLLGSLPFGYLVARSRGVDIFTVGSRSSGATNVRRVLGAGPGNAVLALDALKGAAAAAWPLWVAWAPAAPGPALLGYAGLGGAVLGHSFSCFTRLRGGKGVATAAGGLCVLMPAAVALAAAVWAAVLCLTRYVSLASILAAAAVPLGAYLFSRTTASLAAGSAVAVFVIARHRANIGRLLQGTENRFERRRPPADAPPPP